MTWYVTETHDKDWNADGICTKIFIYAGPMSKEKARELQQKLMNEKFSDTEKVRKELRDIDQGKGMGPRKPVKDAFDRLLGLTYLVTSEEELSEGREMGIEIIR